MNLYEAILGGRCSKRVVLLWDAGGVCSMGPCFIWYKIGILGV